MKKILIYSFVSVIAFSNCVSAKTVSVESGALPAEAFENGHLPMLRILNNGLRIDLTLKPNDTATTNINIANLPLAGPYNIWYQLTGKFSDRIECLFKGKKFAELSEEEKDKINKAADFPLHFFVTFDEASGVLSCKDDKDDV